MGPGAASRVPAYPRMSAGRPSKICGPAAARRRILRHRGSIEAGRRAARRAYCDGGAASRVDFAYDRRERRDARLMITSFRLADFKGHRVTNLTFERFTMLVGDNGSGKTSVLDALWLQSALSPDPAAVLRGNLAPEDLRRRGAKGFTLKSSGLSHGVPWRSTLEINFEDEENCWYVNFSGVGPGGKFTAEARVKNGSGSLRDEEQWENACPMGIARLYRFEPFKIAAEAYADRPQAIVGVDGSQTAVVLAALKLSDDEAFARIETALRALVPSIERIRIKPAEVGRSQGDTVIGHKLYFDYRGATSVPAHHASNGTLILLALLTVLHGPDRPELILIDDFDHALHPRAQMELVRMIKGLLELEQLQETQIIATTHSPYVLDELAPENVIAFALRDDGTVTSKPLSQHPDASKTKGALKSGELWSLDAERDWVLA